MFNKENQMKTIQSKERESHSKLYLFIASTF